MSIDRYFSRRTFFMSLISVGAANAATPLIDINKSHGLLVDIDNNETLFGFNQRINLNKNKYGFFDFELELDQKSFAQDQSRSGAHYIPQKRFEVQLSNKNTGEVMSHWIDVGNHNINNRKADLNYFFRDWRENRSISIDNEILENLFQICEETSGQNYCVYVDITSGYRTKKTNEKLRLRSSNVAKNSLHLKGKAVDFNINGLSHKLLKAKCNEISQGGVGCYPGFFHIDTGPFRRWGI